MQRKAQKTEGIVHKTAKCRQEVALRVLQMLLKVRTRMERLHLACPLIQNKLMRVTEICRKTVQVVEDRWKSPKPSFYSKHS